MDEDENVLAVFYGNRGHVGSQLVVTNRRLLIGPIDTAIAEEILSFGLDKAGVPGIDLVKSVLTKYAPMNPANFWVKHIVDVEPTSKGSLFKAPGLRFRTATDQVVDFAVVVSPRAMNIDPRNRPARDRAVETIRAAMAQAAARG